MITITQGYSLGDGLASSMFADRKRLFVDLLEWNVPVADRRHEIDAYDGEGATYLIARQADGSHAASLRLLPTVRPHLLSDVFASLCDASSPSGPEVREITRLCLPVRHGAAGRLALRNHLISAMIDHALDISITTLIGVVTARYRQQVLAMGWRCAPLGPIRTVAGARLGAFRVDLDGDTPSRLAASGIYIPGTCAAYPARAA